MEPDKVKESLKENNYEYIKAEIKIKKAIDFLVEHAVVKTAE